jgi:hypothetical protein
MHTAAWKAMPLVLAATVLGWGCSADAGDAVTYEPCHGEGEACKDGSVCAKGRCGGSLPCVYDADCPPLAGFTPVCEIFLQSPAANDLMSRECVISCAGTGACPFSMFCEPRRRLDGTPVHLCR